MILKDGKIAYGMVCEGCNIHQGNLKNGMRMLPEGWSRLSIYTGLTTGFGQYWLNTITQEREYCPKCSAKIAKTNKIPRRFVSNVKIGEDKITYRFGWRTHTIELI